MVPAYPSSAESVVNGQGEAGGEMPPIVSSPPPPHGPGRIEPDRRNAKRRAVRPAASFPFRPVSAQAAFFAALPAFLAALLALAAALSPKASPASVARSAVSDWAVWNSFP